MSSVRLVVSTTKRLAPLVSEALFLAGAQGIEERASRGATLVTYDTERKRLSALWERTLARLLLALPAKQLPQATLEDGDETWKQTWAEHLRPVRITPRLWLAPVDAPPAKLGRGQSQLVYRPALAFGDGDHPTTRLIARAIERHYRAAPGGALLDIGAGTGVLSLVAVKSGARRALGSDTDPEAVRAASKNAALNELGKSTRFVAASARLTGKFDLVAINIELRPLLKVLERLPAAARRAPRLLVTGILKAQAAEVARALKTAGFRARRLESERARRQEWVLLEGRR